MADTDSNNTGAAQPLAGYPPQKDAAAPQGAVASPDAAAPQGAVVSPDAAAPQGAVVSPDAAAPQGAVASSDTAAPQDAVASTKTAPKKKLKSAGLLGKKKAKPTKAKTPVDAEKDPTHVPSGALVSIVTRNEYYKDGFRNLLKIAFVEGVVIVGLIMALLFFMYTTKPQDRYFATTADGRIMKMTPLNEPNMNPAALMSWVAQAATEVMTFGFHDYRRRLSEAQAHFTRRGWESFTQALTRSRILEMVEQNQQVVTAVPRSAPTLLQEGIVKGKYRWYVQLPLLVTYKSGAQSRAEKLNIRIAVERVPTLENASGVGIAQWIAR